MVMTVAIDTGKYERKANDAGPPRDLLSGAFGSAGEADGDGGEMRKTIRRSWK
jgi:hypothetical protein